MTILLLMSWSWWAQAPSISSISWNHQLTQIPNLAMHVHHLELHGWLMISRVRITSYLAPPLFNFSKGLSNPHLWIFFHETPQFGEINISCLETRLRRFLTLSWCFGNHPKSKLSCNSLWIFSIYWWFIQISHITWITSFLEPKLGGFVAKHVTNIS